MRESRSGVKAGNTGKPMNTNAKRMSDARGFTLIELIAVMGIIVALALVVTGGYSGMARAIAEGQATRQFRDAILLARQTACVDGVSTYVYVLSENEYVLCRKIGTVSSEKPERAAGYTEGDQKFKKDAYVIYDYYTDLSGFENEVDRLTEKSDEYKNSDLSSVMTIFDLTYSESHQASSADDIPTAVLRGVDKVKTGLGFCLYLQPNEGRSSLDSKYFLADHDYGIALSPIRYLPKGYEFLTENLGKCLCFDPTGVAGPGTGDHVFTIVEAAFADQSHRQHKVKVEHYGKITVEEPK